MNTKLRNAEIYRRAKNGDSLASIGRNYGLSRQRIEQIVKKLSERGDYVGDVYVKKNKYGIPLIKIARISRGFVLDDVGCVTNATLSNIEGGYKQARSGTAKKLCEFYNVPFNALFSHEEEK